MLIVTTTGGCLRLHSVRCNCINSTVAHLYEAAALRRAAAAAMLTLLLQLLLAVRQLCQLVSP
jgi:hypothetical protein